MLTQNGYQLAARNCVKLYTLLSERKVSIKNSSFYNESFMARLIIPSSQHGDVSSLHISKSNDE